MAPRHRASGDASTLWSMEVATLAGFLCFLAGHRQCVLRGYLGAVDYHYLRVEKYGPFVDIAARVFD
jgi:hypothetical protein